MKTALRSRRVRTSKIVNRTHICLLIYARGHPESPISSTARRRLRLPGGRDLHCTSAGPSCYHEDTRLTLDSAFAMRRSLYRCHGDARLRVAHERVASQRSAPFVDDRERHWDIVRTKGLQSADSK